MIDVLEESSWTSASHTSAAAERYRVLYELGHGGMARVYLAERRSHGIVKLVVLKVMEPSLATDESMRALFRKEAMICARLNHPNIVQVYEVLDNFRVPAMVMEYIEGVSFWQARQTSTSDFPLRLQLHVLSQVLAALHYFHEIEDSSGVVLNAVHRDVTPQNVIVMHAGVVKVLDFGVAKVRSETDTEQTQTGVVKGKLKYMPKEQIMGDASIDRRADIFAVGVMLWETLARQRMWGDKNPPEIYQALFTDKIPDIKEACPDISARWEEIVRRATAPNRDDRYPTALDMQMAMEHGMEEYGGPVRQRELADFMKAQFGALRQEQANKLETERQKPALPFPGMEMSNAHTMVGSTLTITPGHLLKNKKQVLLFAAILPLILIALGGALYPLYAKLSEVPANQSIEVSPDKPVELTISAFPEGAKIELDGRRMSNPMRQDFIPSSRTHAITITAEGYKAETREVVMDRGMSLEVRLAPLPKAETGPVAVELASLAQLDPAETTQTKPRTTTSTPTKTPQKRTVTKKPAQTSCNPPYRIGADGVKTFKLECL